MKVFVVYDDNGQIISLAEKGWTVDPRGPKSAPGRMMEGQRAAEVDVPEEHADRSLLELHQLLQVDPATKQLVRRES
jgi:hypothetical protein